MSTVRLAHFSDIHLTAPKLGWTVRDVVGKRASGWVNIRLLGRGRRFRHAARVIGALRAELFGGGFDHLCFSGDATHLGFESEMAAAADLLGVNDPTAPPGIAVPGNHDLYTFGAARGGAFEKYFGPWLGGERVDGEPYPFARKVGHVWLIGVNSSTPNLLLWDARGRVGGVQLDRLRRLTADLGPGPRVIVSHYPILTKTLRPEQRWHRLRDWAGVRSAVAECGVGLWLHGHKHRWYMLAPSDRMPFATIGVGSSTQTGLWAYHDYTLTGFQLTGKRRVYDQDTGGFRDADRFEFELPGPR